MASALISTFEGITHSWDSNKRRPDQRSGHSGDLHSVTQPSNVLAGFEGYEDFFQDHIIDYNIDALFAPLTLNEGEHVVLGAASAEHAVFTIQRPSPTGAASDVGALNTRLARQMKWVKSAAAARDERLDEILVQQTDTLSFFAALVGLDESRTPWTIALLEAVLRFGAYIEMPMKLHFNAARPCQMSSIVQPVIQPPTHGGFPSGHALEAYAVATLLYGLVENSGFEGNGGQSQFNALKAFDASDRGSGGDRCESGQHAQEQLLLMRLAARIAENRTVAGVHFPADSFVGAGMGLAIGEYLVNVLSGKATSAAYSMSFQRDCERPSLFCADFRHDTLALHAPAESPIARVNGAINLGQAHGSPILREIWARARVEMSTPSFE